MALRGNRPDFFAGLAGGGGPGGCEGFFFLRRCCNGTRLPAQIAGFFAGVGRWGVWVPGGCEGFSFLRRCCNGTRLPAQIAGFFAGVGGWRWVPGGCGDFSPLLRFAGGDRRRDAPSLRRCYNGTRLPAQIAGFFAGLAAAGAWVPGGCGDFSPLLRFAGGTGGGMLRLCGVVITGQGSRRKLPDFFAGVGWWRDEAFARGGAAAQGGG